MTVLADTANTEPLWCSWEIKTIISLERRWETRCRAIEATQSTTGFAPASETQSGLAYYINLESPRLWQVCEMKEQNNTVQDQVLVERMQTTTTEYLGRKKKKTQLLAGEWQSRGEITRRNFFQVQEGMRVGDKDWASWQKDQKPSPRSTLPWSSRRQA